MKYFIAFSVDFHNKKAHSRLAPTYLCFFLRFFSRILFFHFLLSKGDAITCTGISGYSATLAAKLIIKLDLT